MIISDKSKLINFTIPKKLGLCNPTIAVTSAGRIFIAYFNDVQERDFGKCSVVVKSEDGVNFSESIAIAYAGKKYKCLNPCLWIDPLGRLWFIWSRMPKNAVFASICNDPDAQELVWSEEFEIGKDVLMSKPTVLSTGEWLFPISVHNNGIKNVGTEYGIKKKSKNAFVYKTVDNGNTFEKIGGAYIPDNSFGNQTISELSDGVLAMYVSTTNGIGVSYSFDIGETWTKGVDSKITNCSSSFFIKRLISGRVLIVKSTDTDNPKGLEAVLFENDGETWKYKLILDDKECASSPDVSQTEDGCIYITYSRESENCNAAQTISKEIIYHKITEEDIIAGEIKDSRSKLSIVVTESEIYHQENYNLYNNDDSFSEKELASYLAKKKKHEIVSYLFEHYNINCLNMHKLDSEKLDKLIETLSKRSYNNEKTILEIIKLMSSVTESKREDIPIVKRVKDIIMKNLGEDVSISDIADEIGIGKHYMCHVFKRETGITINKYKITVKIAEAKKRLVGANDKITDIAMDCGFGSTSYFCKVFIESEKVSPIQYRKLLKNTNKNDKDTILCSMISHMSILDGIDVDNLTEREDIPFYDVAMPDETYAFLHEAAIIYFKNKLFAAWYNNEKKELVGTTPIRFATSDDDGKTWSKPVTIAVEKSGEILYCPPVFAVDNGKLYMFLNQMVRADHIHSFDLYLYDEEQNKFKELWSRPIPFKLNTNVYKLPDGKLILPGRISHEIDTFPITPAVMISDSGKSDSEWRLVKIQDDGILPDDSKLVHPEVSLTVCNGKIYAFCRNDQRSVPLLYVSEDNGESWSRPYSHDIPFSNSKIYSGTLSDGRNYVVGNIYYSHDNDTSVRNKLAVFFSEKNIFRFTKAILLQKGKIDEKEYSGAWHYPCCHEHNNKLYVIYTANTMSGGRGASVSVIDLNRY